MSIDRPSTPHPAPGGLVRYGSVCSDRPSRDPLAEVLAENERLRVTNADMRHMIDGLETAAHEERAAALAILRAQ